MCPRGRPGDIWVKNLTFNKVSISYHIISYHSYILVNVVTVLWWT